MQFFLASSFSRGSLRSAAFLLQQPGDLSEPFPADGHWNLLLLVERVDSVERPYESVRAQLERELRRQRAVERYRNVLETQRRALGVEVDAAVIGELGPPAPPRDREAPRVPAPVRPDTSEAPPESH